MPFGVKLYYNKKDKKPGGHIYEALGRTLYQGRKSVGT